MVTRWSHTSRISTCLLFGVIATKRASCASHLRFSPACSNPRCLLPLVASTLPADPPLLRYHRDIYLVYQYHFFGNDILGCYHVLPYILVTYTLIFGGMRYPYLVEHLSFLRSCGIGGRATCCPQYFLGT